MKKLLYTTAIAGAVLSYQTVASAETKLTGNLGVSFFAVAPGQTSPGTTAFNGMGYEKQFNITNSGDLNNGMKYAAGMSFEYDGKDDNGYSTGATTENTFIDIISGGTTFSVGSDHWSYLDGHASNMVGIGYVGADGANGTSAAAFPTHPSSYSSLNIGLKQNIGVGDVYLMYSPSGDATANNDIGNGLSNAQDSDATSSREIGFAGDLGVKGLSVAVGWKSQDKRDNQTRDQDGNKQSIKYTMGQVTVGADKIVKSDGTNETTGKAIGLGYAVNDQLSLGIYRGRADTTAASSVKENTTGISIGYNLGAVAIQTSYKNVSDLGGTSGQDGKLIGVLVSTKF
jgi:hypothetical protein